MTVMSQHFFGLNDLIPNLHLTITAQKIVQAFENRIMLTETSSGTHSDKYPKNLYDNCIPSPMIENFLKWL